MKLNNWHSIILILLLHSPLILYSQQTDILIDQRDGEQYKIIKLGDTWWMAENLRFASDSNSYCYDNDTIFCKKAGRLYQYITALHACPSDWELPNHIEWQKMIDIFGGDSIAGRKLKSEDFWFKSKVINTNESGFDAIGAGYRLAGGYFTAQKGLSIFWTSTPVDFNHAKSIILNCDKDNVVFREDFINYGYSIRCIKKK